MLFHLYILGMLKIKRKISGSHFQKGKKGINKRQSNYKIEKKNPSSITGFVYGTRFRLR